MTTPMNGSLARARQSVPTFTGTMPDASVAQAHALIGIGEVLQQILVELQKQNQQAQQLTAQRRPRGRQPERGVDGSLL